jgi:uncharacterized protein YlbG (UPF0298 family)
MSVRIKKIVVLSFLMIFVLAAVPASVNAGIKIGNAYVVSDAPEVEVFPSVAYNSTRQEYLVVWFNDRAGNDDIRAQRLTRDGLKIGSAFYISAGAGHDRRYPDVAYNSQHDQYMVVWENEDPSGYISIRARFVSGTGVVSPADIVLTGGSNLYTPVTPAVAYASTSDRYMVVWAETWHTMPITYVIYAQKVIEDGTMEDAATEVAKNTTSYLQEPDIAYNRHADRHLVVWQQYDSSAKLWDIKGRQVHGGGGNYSTEIGITYLTVSCTNPAIASIPTSSSNYKFLVTYEADYVTDKNIFVNLIEEDGTVGSIQMPGFSNNDETFPAVAGNELSQGYQFSSSGIGLGTHYEFSGPATDNPAVAAGHMADFLIAWQDQPVFGTNMNIYAQLFGNREFVPLFLNKP